MEHKPIHKIKLDLHNPAEEDQKEFEFVDCPSCNSQVNADSISLDNLMAKCGGCNAVFSIEDVKSVLNTKSKEELPIDRPDGVDKYYFGDELDLTIAQTGFTFEWIFAICGPFYGLGLFAGYVAGEVPLFISIICFLIGLIAISSLITRKRHQSHIRVGKEIIDVIHRPKKFNKNVEFSTSEIEQVYVTYQSPTHKNIYAVKAVFNGADGQKHETLIKGIRSIRIAKYLEQEIENHLGIENKKVIEEV